MLKKILLITMLSVFLTACGGEALEYPDLTAEHIHDAAFVLSEAFKSDLSVLSTRVYTQTGGKIYLASCHFLGGHDVREYAKSLFEANGLSDRDTLLVMAVGENEENSYCLIPAASVSDDQRLTLLSVYFKNDYLNRSYEQAVSELMKAYFKTLDSRISTNDLFLETVSQPEMDQYAYIKEKSKNQKQETEVYPYTESPSFSWTWLLILLPVALILFISLRGGRNHRVYYGRPHSFTMNDRTNRIPKRGIRRRDR